MGNKWEVIGSYIASSLAMMGCGFLAFIPICAIYLFGYWVLFRPGGNEQFGDGTIFVMVLLYVFSICLWSTYFQRKEDESSTAERGRNYQILLRLEHDYAEVNRRASELIDRIILEADDDDIQLNQTNSQWVAGFSLTNDILIELEFIRDQQLLRHSGGG